MLDYMLMSTQGNSIFEPTRWTLVQQIQQEPEKATRALEELYRMYWKPLYAYARSFGRSAEDAEDVVQGFMSRGIEKSLFSMAKKEKGKMRTFLLTSFKNYLRDEHIKNTAAKRGGGMVEARDLASEESKISSEQSMDPRVMFDKRWAMVVVEAALKQLEQRYADEGKKAFFNLLSPCLTGELSEGYQVLADQLGVSLSSVKVGIHRMRKRYGEVLRSEIAETITAEEDPDDELRYLINILAE